MKDEFGQNTDNRISLVCHRNGGGRGVDVDDCAEKAEGNEQGMPEIVVQLEDEQPQMSPKSDSLPENDMFLYAPVSDIEEEDGDYSDSSNVPTGIVKHQSTSPRRNDVTRIKLEKCAEENNAIPKTDQKTRRKKTSNTSAKRSNSITNGQTKRRGKKSLVITQQCKSGRAEHECKVSGETAGWIPAPYTKPETVLSPQAALEAPGFPSLQCKAEQFCDNKDNILLEVLKYCQTLCTVVQRLEQKIDSLQADCSWLYLHMNKNTTKEPCTSSILRRNQSPRISRKSQCKLPSNENPVVCGSQVEGYSGEAVMADTSRNAQIGRGGRGGGGKRGRRQGSGKSQAASRKRDLPFRKEPPVRANQPKRRVTSPVAHDDGPCASKVAKILSELQGRRSAVVGSVEDGHETTNSKSTSDGKEQQVMIGSAFRKVWIPYSVYMEAFKQDEPQKALVPVLHAVFPQSVLSCSAVIGNPRRGIRELSPNKLEAIREWLAEMYPMHKLEVKGKAWAECLGVLNTITRKLKSDTTPTKNPLPEVH